jgi:hypothetical protein
MATKPLIFKSVTVGGNDFSLHLVEGAEVTIEEQTDLVDDGQTLVSSYDVAFSVPLYSSAVINDPNVNSNASATPVKTWIRFDGSDGAATLNVTNVIVNARPSFENNRVAYVLTGSKRGVTVNVVAVS